MSDPNFILLYVDNPLASAAFYTELLGHPPAESSPTFVMFVLSSGVMLGLWSRHTVEPLSTTRGGGSELAFTVADMRAPSTPCTRPGASAGSPLPSSPRTWTLATPSWRSIRTGTGSGSSLPPGREQVRRSRWQW